ncbi:unnamed protein product (macronuclear) [Paramecium tetraurelia]|uniref:Transmembrane protein n=1 Tax=Paramecium tetraurelia TaxID=5888 RepID=A0CZK5_PARTE|nr:uncharacterized protein GSPATT00011795001 [Paramecium tetraurelia]CAK76222.1 unnamed protein product [Paramecium tetraurelia]|eukprot:XP_001443619.1 hypothetical protein (macronuclear) [Paramecium tetraurelia strain d4-2]
MFHQLLLPPNRNTKKDSKPDQNTKNIQKNQLPQLSKYIENELMKRSVQKEQERRISLQQQSNQIDEDFKNSLLLQRRVNKKEIDLSVGQRNSIILDVTERKPHNKLKQLQHPISQCITIENKLNYNGDKEEPSNKLRSISVNQRNPQYSHSYLMEQETPNEFQKNMFQCNQILDFKIYIDSQHSHNQMEKKQGKQIPNYINFFENKVEQPYKYGKKDFQKYKKTKNILKLWGFIFIFIFRLIKQLRIKQLKTIQNLRELRVRLESSNQQQIVDIKMKWHDKLMEKVLLTIKQNKFSSNFKENQNPNDKKFIQNRKQWMINLTLLFFQNLDLMTKAANLNQEILLQAQNHILQINKKCSLYVAKRIKTKLNSKEKLLIICDYLFLSFIIDEIIKNSNQLQCINEHHLAESKFQLVSICSLIQILYMNYFKELQVFQPKVLKIIQKRLNINKTKNQELKIIEDENIDQNEIIILGLNNLDFYENLIKENQKWYDEIQTFFRNSINNLASQNNI